MSPKFFLSDNKDIQSYLLPCQGDDGHVVSHCPGRGGQRQPLSLSPSLSPWRDVVGTEGSATGGDEGMQKAEVQVAEGWEEVWMQV